MGEALSWIATKGLATEAIYSRLRLSPTGAVGDYVGADGGSRTLPGGWTLIVLARAGHPLATEQELRSLSAGCEVVACIVEEHIMFSSSEHWNNGDRLWRVEHEGDTDILGLRTFGDLPANFATIEKNCRANQAHDGGASASVDHMFEIPLVLAQSITSFKHDATELDDFELLDWQKPKSR